MVRALVRAFLLLLFISQLDDLRPTITKATTRTTARNPYDFSTNLGSALSVVHYNESGIRTAFSPSLAGSDTPQPDLLGL